MTDTDTDMPSGSWRLLTQGSFATFFWGNGFSLAGTWMQRIAAAWLIWEWTGSGFWLGMLAAGDLLPVMIVGPFAGVVADRWNLRWLNLGAQLVSMVISILAMVLLMTGHLALWSLLVLSTLQGALIGLVQPARMSMMQQMVRRVDIARAVALNSVNVNTARLIGPAVAGAVILHAEVHLVFALNAALTSIFCVQLLRLKLTYPAPERATGAFLTQLGEGFRYAMRARAMRLTLVILLLGGVCVRAAQELLPAVAAQSFGDTATGLATLTGAGAVGAIIAALTMPTRSLGVLMHNMALSWGLAALAAIVMVLMTSPLGASAAAILLGAGVTRGVIATQTMVQLGAPPILRGRALSLQGLIARGSPALGALLLGFLADRIGLALTVGLSAAGFLLILVGLLPWIRADGDNF